MPPKIQILTADASYNSRATLPGPLWRKVIVVLAYDLGFRFQTPAGRVSVSVFK